MSQGDDPNNYRPQGQQFSGGHYTDMIINNIIATNMAKILKADFQITPLNILKLLLLLSTNEIKNGFNLLMVYLFSLIKKSPELSMWLIGKLGKLLKMDRRNKIKVRVVDPIEKYDENLFITVDHNFMQAFYNYLNKNNNVTFTKSLNEIIIKNTKEQIFNEKINNINITFKDMNIAVDGEIVFGKNIFNGEIISSDHIGSPINRYIDLLSKEQAEVIKQVYDYLINQYGSDKLLIDYLDNYILHISSDTSAFSERIIADLIAEKYLNLKRDQTLIEIIILSSILYKNYNITTISESLETIKYYNKTLFDLTKTYKLKNTYLKIKTYINDFSKNILDILINLGLFNKTLNLFADFKKKVNLANIKNNNENGNNKTDNKMTLCLNITSHQPINTNEVISTFLNEVYKSYRTNTSKVKIFSLQLEEDKIITEKDNPDYEAYIERKQTIEKMNITADKCPVDVLTFLNQTPPPKTIKAEKLQKKVVSKQLNEIEKNIDTLFLRESDKQKLLNSLTQFRDKSDILKELGLQNKLNLLLYGIPGTGKSTTIQAVATFLQRDIYYVDLQKAKLNEELQMIFEYVNKYVPNSGIVVIEDIDAMTDVVHKRGDAVKEDMKVSEIMNNQSSKLSLEYFLNILQGTLTMDGSIFIVTTNHLEVLDPAFYRDGRFDVKVELKLCDHHQIKQIYRTMMKRDLSEDVLDKIPENKYSPATIIYHIKNYIFDSGVSDEEIMGFFYRS